MSLLMEALKKAEEAKRQASEGNSAESARLEPAEPPAAPVAGSPKSPQGQGLAELAARLDALDNQLALEPQARTAAEPSARPAPEADAERERAAAQNVFAAKQARPATRWRFYAALGFATLIAAGAIAGYFWLQYPATSSLAVAPRATQRATGTVPSQLPPQASPAPALQPTAQAPAQPSPAAPSPSAPADERTTRPASSAAAAPAAERPPQAAPTVHRPSRPPAEPATSPAPPPTALREGDAAAKASIPIRVTTATNAIDPGVSQGFARYNAGDLDGARAAYEQALRADPRNLDALRGVAAISLQQGNLAEAQRYNERVLEADPKDADAYAALINLERAGDPSQAESRLKTLIAAQPDSPRGHFALGNLYARQGRWSEAQQAYFRAHTADPQNPDYQFNLAVSLEQMRQPRIALQYYQNALAAAEARPAAFDRAQATARIRELQR